MIKSNLLSLFVIALFAAIASTASAQVIVDNDGGAPGYTEVGGWTTSGSAGYNGGTYRFANMGDAATATWTADLAEAGDYEVFVWYVPGSNRATSAKYDLSTSSGTQNAYISQVTGGYTWDSLGTFHFNAGSNTVTLDVAGSTGGSVAIADAVRFGGDTQTECTIGTPDEVAPGVFHTEYTCPGPLVAHVLEFDLEDPAYTIEMGFAQGKRNYGTSRQTVTSIIDHYDSSGHNVVGAINCAFFSYDSIWLLGGLGSKGDIIGFPDGNETYVLQESGESWMDRGIPGATAGVRFQDSFEMSLNTFNYTCGSNTLSLYTRVWGTSTAMTTETTELVVNDVNFPIRANKDVVGTITAINTGAASINTTIPSDGFVIRACPGAEATLLSHAAVGDQITVRVVLQPDHLNNAQLISGGNGYLVQDGEPYPNLALWGDFGSARHPRTVLAWNGTKHYFVTFDGRQPSYSIGANFGEMADFLISELDAEFAVNFDGGGSTTMVVNDAVANCPSDSADPPCTGTQRAVGNALMLVQRTADSDFPFADDLTAAGRTLSWDDKFSMNPVEAFSPTSPDGDGYVMTVLNPYGGFETASTGSPGDTNYTVSADFYCEYRSDVAADGYELVGLFARDNGNAAFDSTSYGGGNCYAITHNSQDGRIRAGKYVDGVFTDFVATPIYDTTTAWHSFKIFCYGTTIKFFIDDQEIVSATDASHADGRMGVAYHEYFTNDANAHGARVDNVHAFSWDFDYDNDGDVDNMDLAAFAYCMNGPENVFPPTHFCTEMDGDGDLDIDLNDFSVFQYVYTGSN